MWNLQHGSNLDLRDIPSIVGGDPKSRHGIVLAKSTLAKKYGIVTGESLFSALTKCPSLTVVPPKYSVYVKSSDSMVEILKDYTPIIERYSIDECFLEMTPMKENEAIRLAHEIKDRIKKELGFTVNIGIGENKLCAKMASDFKKPDRVHTLFPYEIEKKLWPLPVDDLFMVGSKSAAKLKNINMRTIGDIAKSDLSYLESAFMKYGNMLWNFSNGIDYSDVHIEGTIEAKGMGNSTTLAKDAVSISTCNDTIISLLETLMKRLKDSKKQTSCISVYFTTSSFITHRKQKTFLHPTDSFSFVSQQCKELFKSIYKNQPVRKIGVSFTHLSDNDIKQLSFQDIESSEKLDKVDTAMNLIREKYGKRAVIKASFLSTDIASSFKESEDKENLFVDSEI